MSASVVRKPIFATGSVMPQSRWDFNPSVAVARRPAAARNQKSRQPPVLASGRVSNPCREIEQRPIARKANSKRPPHRHRSTRRNGSLWAIISGNWNGRSGLASPPALYCQFREPRAVLGFRPVNWLNTQQICWAIDGFSSHITSCQARHWRT
jgi:hypothetical protein